jgi:hypothetical protein
MPASTANLSLLRSFYCSYLSPCINARRVPYKRLVDFFLHRHTCTTLIDARVIMMHTRLIIFSRLGLNETKSQALDVLAPRLRTLRLDNSLLLGVKHCGIVGTLHLIKVILLITGLSLRFCPDTFRCIGRSGLVSRTRHCRFSSL